MIPTSRSLALVLSVAVLTGCASARGASLGGDAPALPAVTVNEFIAMQPAERQQEIAAAQRELRMAERRAERAAALVPVAETQLRIARADVQNRKAAVQRSDANVALVRRQHEAVFLGVPADTEKVPEDVEQALRRLDEAEHAVDVARWEQEAAEALERVREEELAYAQAFRNAAQRDVELQQAETDLARIRLVTRATADILPGVADPRLSLAQSRVQEARAGYAEAHAEAMGRLAASQMRRAGMANYQYGPPAMVSLSGSPGGSEAPGLVPSTAAIEPEPLPWPNAWEEPPAGQPR
ncbi:MAG TPA: hypothetical protein VF406_19515 [Thermodesulfobacteriota bacterium]